MADYFIRPPWLLGLAGARAVLEVVLQNLGGQGGSDSLRQRLSLSPFLRFHGTDYFAAADDFCSRQTGNLRRQHQADFKLHGWIERFLRLEEQSGTADVFGGARTP